MCPGYFHFPIWMTSSSSTLGITGNINTTELLPELLNECNDETKNTIL